MPLTLLSSGFGDENLNNIKFNVLEMIVAFEKVCIKRKLLSSGLCEKWTSKMLGKGVDSCLLQLPY